MDSITYRNTSAVFLLFSFSIPFELVCCRDLSDSTSFSSSSSPSPLKLVSADNFLFQGSGLRTLGVKGRIAFKGGGELRLVFRSRNRSM